MPVLDFRSHPSPTLAPYSSSKAHSWDLTQKEQVRQSLGSHSWRGREWTGKMKCYAWSLARVDVGQTHGSHGSQQGRQGLPIHPKKFFKGSWRMFGKFGAFLMRSAQENSLSHIRLPILTKGSVSPSRHWAWQFILLMYPSGEDASCLQVGGRNTCRLGTLTSLLHQQDWCGCGLVREVAERCWALRWLRWEVVWSVPGKVTPVPIPLLRTRILHHASPFLCLFSLGLKTNWHRPEGFGFLETLSPSLKHASPHIALPGRSVLDDGASWGTHRNATSGAPGVCPGAAPIRLRSHGPTAL